MDINDWTPTASKLPTEGVVVNTMDSGGHVQSLVYEGGLWFFPRPLHVRLLHAAVLEGRMNAQHAQAARDALRGTTEGDA